jgi:cell division protein FtsL
MAVYQGARRRAPLPLGLDGLTGRRGPAAPSDEVAAPARSARTARRSARAIGDRRPSSVGIALAAIVIVFAAAFLSLSQSVRVAATGYDIVRLVSERDRLQAISQDLQSDVDRLRSEPAIRKQALDAGLGQLGAPLVVQAR